MLFAPAPGKPIISNELRLGPAGCGGAIIIAFALHDDFQFEKFSFLVHILVDRLIGKCAETRTRCVFVNQPNAYSPEISEELKVRLWMTPTEESYTLRLPALENLAQVYNTWLITSAARQGMEVCDIASAVPPTTDYLYDDCHFNEGGARLVASLLARCMSK